MSLHISKDIKKQLKKIAAEQHPGEVLKPPRGLKEDQFRADIVKGKKTYMYWYNPESDTTAMAVIRKPIKG